MLSVDTEGNPAVVRVESDESIDRNTSLDYNTSLNEEDVGHAVFRT